MTTYGVLGVGSIASAIVTGLCADAPGAPEPPSVTLSPRGAERAAALAARFPTAVVAASNQAVVDGADLVLVCLRRADVPVLAELSFRPEQVVVSAVPGLSLADLAGLVPGPTLVRAVPMPAVATRAGTTPVHPADPDAVALFERLGTPLPVATEAAFDAISTASATVSTYYAYLGAVAGWLSRHGLPDADAQRYVAATFAGVEVSTDEPLAQQAREHATPGGVNEQVEGALRQTGFFDEVGTALDTVHRRVTG